MNRPTGIVKLVIADDHEIFRDGLRLMLTRNENIQLTGEASNGVQLVQRVAELRPDIVITDIRMPVMDGIAATRQIVEQFPATAVICLSMLDEEDLIMEMLDAGALGYLLKNAEKEELLEAISTVYFGEHYYCKYTSGKLANLIAQSKFGQRNKREKVEFSEKEIEIIQLICSEFSNKEIADQLFMSVRTVEGYRLRILEKVQVKNSIGLVVYAIQHGIFNPSKHSS